ncbi:MAG: winged helix-turn-helix transcriptional regulator [Chloroflexi bacterium]|nr:winged helix-turn-helix transcriptional regulator [Chloroflexota bacterium]
MLTALADPRRRAILRLVRDLERPSGEIAAHFPDVTGPAISQHLRVLREAGLVAERRAGTRRLYRARPEGLRGLREWLRDYWDDALEDLKQAAEAETRQQAPALGAQARAAIPQARAGAARATSRPRRPSSRS